MSKCKLEIEQRLQSYSRRLFLQRGDQMRMRMAERIDRDA